MKTLGMLRVVGVKTKNTHLLCNTTSSCGNCLKFLINFFCRDLLPLVALAAVVCCCCSMSESESYPAAATAATTAGEMALSSWILPRFLVIKWVLNSKAFQLSTLRIPPILDKITQPISISQFLSSLSACPKSDQNFLKNFCPFTLRWVKSKKILGTLLW